MGCFVWFISWLTLLDFGGFWAFVVFVGLHEKNPCYRVWLIDIWVLCFFLIFFAYESMGCLGCSNIYSCFNMTPCILWLLEIVFFAFRFCCV